MLAVLGDHAAGLQGQSGTAAVDPVDAGGALARSANLERGSSLSSTCAVRLSQIEIRNSRCFGSLDNDLKPGTVLIGHENAADTIEHAFCAAGWPAPGAPSIA